MDQSSTRFVVGTSEHHLVLSFACAVGSCPFVHRDGQTLTSRSRSLESYLRGCVEVTLLTSNGGVLPLICQSVQDFRSCGKKALITTSRTSDTGWPWRQYGKQARGFKFPNANLEPLFMPIDKHGCQFSVCRRGTSGKLGADGKWFTRGQLVASTTGLYSDFRACVDESVSPFRPLCQGY